MNRKGFIFDMTVWMWRFMIIIILFAFTFYMLNKVVIINLQSHAAEAGVIHDIILTSPTGISAIDPITGRVIAGTIDADKISNEFIRHSLQNPKGQYAAARITLLDEARRPVKTAYLNEREYTNWEPLAKGLRSLRSGGVFYKKNTHAVRYDNSGWTDGSVEIEVLVPR